MKSPAVLLLTLCAASSLHAQQDPGPWEIRVELQVVSVSMRRGLQMAPYLRNPQTFPQGWSRVQAMLQTGEGKLVDQLQKSARDSMRGESGSRTDHRTAGEWLMTGCRIFEPRYTVFATEVLTSKRGVAPNTPAEEKLLKLGEWMKDSFDPWLDLPQPSSFPTFYEVREAGLILVSEAAYDAGSGEIDVSITAERVGFLGEERSLQRGPESMATYLHPQPRYSRFKVETCFRAQSGQGTLVGSEVEPGPVPRMLLYLVRTTAVPVPLALP